MPEVWLQTLRGSDVIVFVSSVITGFGAEREAVVQACRSLDVKVVKAEDFPASPATPQGACLQGVDSSDCYVLVLGRRYGDIQPSSGKSATEEEFDRARERGKHIYVFLLEGEREPEQAAFIRRISGYEDGRLFKEVSSVSALQAEVVRSLRQLLSGPSADDLEQAVNTNLQNVMKDDSSIMHGPGEPWVSTSWVPSSPLRVDMLLAEKHAEALSELFVVGESRLSDARPHFHEKAGGMVFGHGEGQNRHPLLTAWIGDDGAIAVGSVVAEKSRTRNDAHMASFYFLEPRLLEDRLRRQFHFIVAATKYLDSGRIVSAGRMRVHLGGMDGRTLAELPANHQNGFALPGFGRNVPEGLAAAVPETSAQLTLSQLKSSETLARFVRELRHVHSPAERRFSL